ncbi:MAG TPA: iron-sulfur cluster carrier protein ApbC [Gammaproteobacteria bacterium]|nr:iron-sulfur cluster carrier protein ApbC [Gammaproteobacteria bacterium]
MTVSSADIEQALRGYVDPYLRCDPVQAGMIKRIDVSPARVSVSVEAGFPLARYGAALSQALAAAIATVPGAPPAEIELQTKIIAHAVQKGVKPLAGVRNTIAVASGKGGVGKSTTAVNLALALHREGGHVGLLDADVYGPSLPRMLGCPGRPESRDGKSMEPKEGYGIQCISIGHLVEEDTPMIWRGPMATSALEQLLRETNWRDLDYLVIDLPPGTGDIQLTLCQKIPVSGAVIVTTPQDIALLDARKGLKMFEKVDVPVLGIVENMSLHQCSKCGHVEHIFGAGGGAAMAQQYGVDLLGALPLDIRIREGVDSGRPTVAVDPDSAAALEYGEIARKVAAKLALRAKDYSSRFPNIVIKNS